MANVIFKFGTRAQYDALITKEEHTLYWLSDTQELMKGSICYGKGSNATQQAAGLLSPEDKKKLDELSAAGVFNLAPVDASVIITDVADGKTIGVQLSKVEGNILTIKDDGLFAKVDAVPLESVTGLKERLEAIEQAAAGGVHYKGSVATFEELPVDAEQGDLWEVTADNSEWCWNGEKWFEYGSTSGLKPIARADYNTEQNIVDWNDAVAKEHEHANKDVIDGITAEKVAVWDGAQAAAEATAAAALSGAKTELEGKIADAQAAAEKVANDNNAAMDTRMQAVEGKAHEHANKAELDKIADGDKAKWDAASAKAHEHANATTLAGVTDEKVAAWDAAESNAKAYTDAALTWGSF